MESGLVGFALFKAIQSEEEMDPHVVSEWWLRFKFWAHVIDAIRLEWIAYVAKAFL